MDIGVRGIRGESGIFSYKRQECTCQYFSSFKADRPTGYRKFLRISNIKEKWNDDNSLLSFHFFNASTVGPVFPLLPWALAHKVCHTHQTIYPFIIHLVIKMNEFMMHFPYPVLSLTLIKYRNDCL